MQSPFEPALPAEPQTLPPTFRDQFLIGPESLLTVALDGRLDVTRRAWLAPLFFTLARLGLLVAQSGRGVPVTLDVAPGRDARGEPWQINRRRFGFARPEQFNTLTVWDAKRKRIIDLTGPGGLMQIVWATRFDAPGTIRFEHGCFALGGRRGRIVLPRLLSHWLMGDPAFTQTVDAADPDVVRIDFTLAHPLLGELFAYRGDLRIRRAPRAT